MLIKSTVVYSSILGLYSHSSLSHLLIHPEQLPVFEASFMEVPYTDIPFFTFYAIFLLYLFYA